jgi:hypothetical protein
MKINSSFSNLTPANFVAQVEQIISSLTGNANFPEPWPASVVSLAQLQADLADFQTILNAIANKDRSRMEDRDAQRQKMAGELTSLAFYLQGLANGDPTKLATTGFPARKASSRSQAPVELEAPSQLRLQRGVVSGQLIARAIPVAKAASYTLQIATADPTVEANWTDAGTYANCGRIQLDGLKPGTMYSVRMRAIGAAGSGAWTAPTSLMVV